MFDSRSAAIYIAKVIKIGEEKDHKGWLKLKLTNPSIWSHAFWAAPAMQPNITWIPDEDELVFVFFESGSWNDAYWFGLCTTPNKFPIELSGKEYPKNRVVKTKKGHSLEISDTDGAERISFKSSPKNGKQHELSLNSATEEIVVNHSSGKYTMKVTKEGSIEVLSESIKLRSKDVDANTGNINLKAGDSVRVVDANGNELLMNSSGVQIKDRSGNITRLNKSGIEIKDKSGSKIQMVRGKVLIEAKGDVVLNGGTQGVVRSGDVSAAHTHIIATPTGPGTASPAIVVFPPSNVSKRVKSG